MDFSQVSLLDFDLKSLIPYAIEGWVHVLGEEHQSMITERLNRMVLVPYYDIDSLRSCLNFWRRCKQRECSVLFLEQIGEDVEQYKKESYTVSLDPHIEELLELYIGNYYKGIRKQTITSTVPLCGFDPDNTGCSLKSKLKLINYLRGSGVDPITEESFDRFCQTEEYELLLHRIQEIRSIYDGVVAQYMEWEKQLEPYEKYIASEVERKKFIFRQKEEEIWQDILSKFPSQIRDLTVNKSSNDLKKIILGYSDLNNSVLVEYFNSDCMKQLTSFSGSIDDRYEIIFMQYRILLEMGIKMDFNVVNEMFAESRKGNFQPYFKWIECESIKKYVPSCEFADYVVRTWKMGHQNAEKEWYMTREDFRNAAELLEVEKKTSYIAKKLYSTFKDRVVHVDANISCMIDGKEDIPKLFYTFRDFGFMFIDFIHECGHALGIGSKTGGLEPLLFPQKCFEQNPYWFGKRKYERFDETVTDMFTMAVMDWFQSQNIYFLESKEFTFVDYSNLNTFSITKDLLRLLVEKYGKSLRDAYVCGGPAHLIQHIGEDNFEELVDCVNMVDYLFKKRQDEYFATQHKGNLECVEVSDIVEDYFRQGVLNFDTNSSEPDILEYMKQLKRVEGIYQNIDQYRASTFMNDQSIGEEMSGMRR